MKIILQKSEIFKYVNSDEGFAIFKAQEIYQNLKYALHDELKIKFSLFDSTYDELIHFISVNRFHEIKTKNNRILNKQNSNRLQKLIFQYLNLNENDGFISDEELIGHPNFNWRLVRGNSPSDVGPIHADKWFWDLNKDLDIYPNSTRIKVWVPLIQYDNEYSLCVLPGSHKEKYDYDSIIEAGTKKIKPLINDKYTFRMQPAIIPIGSIIVFNDNLLHGGLSSHNLRNSIEFTLILNSNK